MKLLLDTHILLWSLLAPEKLSKKVAACLEDPDNQLWLSPITSWEVMVLAEKKRVSLKEDPHKWLKRVLEKIPFQEAALTHEVAMLSRGIRLPHQDPADRFLAATAKVYGLTLVTSDKHLLKAKACKTLANRS